jgi:hypothetical protein
MNVNLVSSWCIAVQGWPLSRDLARELTKNDNNKKTYCSTGSGDLQPRGWVFLGGRAGVRAIGWRIRGRGGGEKFIWRRKDRGGAGKVFQEGPSGVESDMFVFESDKNSVLLF